mmetsp:Transcript_41497/g.130744  ORF Transcript_41497/g.130744 Transcript_41497/m.130744 type:complete len:221 (-) Transcript_41497:655-1317(-)
MEMMTVSKNHWIALVRLSRLTSYDSSAVMCCMSTSKSASPLQICSIRGCRVMCRYSSATIWHAASHRLPATEGTWNSVVSDEPLGSSLLIMNLMKGTQRSRSSRIRRRGHATATRSGSELVVKWTSRRALETAKSGIERISMILGRHRCSTSESILLSCSDMVAFSALADSSQTLSKFSMAPSRFWRRSRTSAKISRCSLRTARNDDRKFDSSFSSAVGN